MRQLIAGNWKMNGLSAQALALAQEIADGVRDMRAELRCDLVICPPAITLAAVARVFAGTPVGVGGQDCNAAPEGPHTGDISAAMLHDAGASWVILGHSERRADHHETDDGVRSKVLAAVACGLTPIVCMGETAEQRESGRETEVVGWQIAGSLPKDFNGAVAYEPIWAIGTGRAATADDVAAMHAFIRAELRRELGPHGADIRILYGGSVKPDNAVELLAIPEVGGALVGGASLIGAEFLAIARAARG